MRVGCLFVANQVRQGNRTQVVGYKAMAGQGTESGQGLLRILERRLIGGGYANAYKALFGNWASSPLIGLQQPVEDCRMILMTLPGAAKQDVHIK
jgi:hypothetical protein